MFIPFEEVFPGKGKEADDILEGRVLLSSYASVLKVQAEDPTYEMSLGYAQLLALKDLLCGFNDVDLCWYETLSLPLFGFKVGEYLVVYDDDEDRIVVVKQEEAV